ncbi:Phthalate dioxygenase reductase [Paraburkholderia caffeinitolerans]|uniref:Phthalate dioxygenase reductase n=1 Tax=Paraburkholderia caffeinitolerans TaxID=1723730 RepID=A0A6J5FVM5_9BURK|nr:MULTISPECIES: PDR/VanB family oxidoreductase [Paraburkholderia]CAB3788288.1 Phthalate dioxygenase reductase [Paraburkholderia caffeinitolerans]
MTHTQHSPPDARWPLELEVVASEPLTNAIRGLTFKSAGGGALPGFTAGAHIRIQTAASPDDERSYSLINSANQSGHYEIAVKLEPNGRGGSRRMHALQPGERLRASLPKNDFPLHGVPHEAVLIAGGIGITPILSMARTLAASGARFQLHYACRTPGDAAFREEVAQSCGAHAHLYFDHGDPSRGMPLAQVIGGYYASGAKRHLYVCGPRPLIDAVIATARALHWPADHVHFELFGAPSAAPGDRACRVELRRSGRTLDVGPQQSILDAMIDAGLDPLFDCRRGECGVCALRVLEGTPEHRDYALGDEEREQQMCICVSRARSESLVLDA